MADPPRAAFYGLSLNNVRHGDYSRVFSFLRLPFGGEAASDQHNGLPVGIALDLFEVELGRILDK
jgi:hypothetical protein